MLLLLFLFLFICLKAIDKLLSFYGVLGVSGRCKNHSCHISKAHRFFFFLSGHIKALQRYCFLLILMWLVTFGNPYPVIWITWTIAQRLQNKPVCPSPYPICSEIKKEQASGTRNVTDLWSHSVRREHFGTERVRYFNLTGGSNFIYGNFSPQALGGSLADFDLDGTYEARTPDHLKAWKDPDVDAVLNGCAHLSRFGADAHFEGELDNYEYRMAVYSIVFNLLGAEAHDWVHERWSQAKGYDEGKVENELIMSARVIPGPYTCEEMLKASDLPCPVCESKEFTSPINIKPKDYIETEATGFWITNYDKSGNIKSQSPAYDDLYKKWTNTHEHIAFADNQDIIIYNGTYWENFLEAFIDNFAQNTMKPKPRKRHRVEFISQVKAENVKERDWSGDSTEGFINLQNGVYNIKEDRMVPHSSDFGFFYQLPYSYDPEARCPRFEKFLDEVTVGREDIQKVLIEFMGYAMANGPCLAEKAMILFGHGSNGKSTFMDVLKALAGKDNYSSLSLTALNRDSKRAMIEGKLFNIGEETNVRALSDSEVFKTMVTGGEIDIKLLYRNEYTIKNKAKLIMACNELPKSSDRSDGLYRRMILVPFDAKFTEESKDPLIREKLQAELPGIFNLAIKGYRKLADNNFRFSKAESLEQVIDEYKLENDNVLMWAKENVEPTSEASEEFMFKHEMYDSYKRMCDEDGSFTVSKTAFFKNIKRIHPHIRESKRYHPMQGKVRVLVGLKRVEL